MDGILTIITLLLIIIPVIAKAIEKVLMQAGRQSAAGKVRDFRKHIEGDKTGFPAGGDVHDEPFPTVVYTPEVSRDSTEPPAFQEQASPAFSVIPDDLLDDGYRSIKDIVADRKRSTPAAAVRNMPEKKSGVDIDPKKLIIYSEIMKTKF